jgi:hypothetical protein
MDDNEHEPRLPRPRGGRAHASRYPRLWNPGPRDPNEQAWCIRYPRMIGYWLSPDGRNYEVVVDRIVMDRPQRWKPRLVAEYVPSDDQPLQTKQKPGPKPTYDGEAGTAAQRQARRRARLREQAAPRTVEDQMTSFYKCDCCRMYHRADFTPGRDVRWEQRANGKPDWIQPSEQWVWGSINELPAGAVLVDAPDTMEQTI